MPSNYSIEEVDTGYVWIDGSKIYKKTIPLGNLPNSNSKTVPHNISNLGYVTEYSVFATDGNIQIPLPFSWPLGTNGDVALYIDGGDIRIITGSDRSGSVAYATLCYTKTS